MDKTLLDEIPVGSIWEGVCGMDKSDVGKLIKVTRCIGNLIEWNYLKDPDRVNHCTCSISFKLCFKKVQDNDNDAVYSLIENPNKMVKVVNSHSTSSTNGEWIYGYIEYNDIPISKCRHVDSLDNFHKKYTLFSLDPIKEFSVDKKDPMHANRITDTQEDTKVEDNGTYLKTDKNKLEDFGSGAKREDKTGKGRYDLIPGDVMNEFEDFVWESYFKNGPTTCAAIDVSKSAYFEDWQNIELYYDFIFNMISYIFVPLSDCEECEGDNGEFSYVITWEAFRIGLYEMRKALADHYEAGAKVHGVDNWKKGIPVYGSERGGCFLDSMRRHTDQALQGKTDEPHAVAALWNAFCAVWTLKHKPHSTMYQNASEVKAESVHFDMVDAAIDKSVDKIADGPTTSYGVLKANMTNCVELLSKMLVDNKTTKLKYETHDTYINLYMLCVLLKEHLMWFEDNNKARVCIENIISGIYNLINANIPPVKHIFGNVKAEWIEGYGDLPVYEVCLGHPDKYRIMGMIELCGRTGVRMMNDDHFCGRAISSGILFKLNDHLKELIKE